MLSRRALMASGLAPLMLPACGAFAQTSAPSSGMTLGVQTHFSHGWHLPWMDIARSLGATTLRDGLNWSTIEKKPGEYTFDRFYVDYLEAARRKRMDVLLTILPNHPAYDGGQTAHTPEAMSAYANYLAAILDRYPDVVTAIEVGNEINGQGGMSGPAARDRARSHVALLRAVHDRIKPTHSRVAILGASTNVIGIGFQEQIFAAGGLEVMDGVAVHPYRAYAEHVDVELAALTAAMKRHGRPVPIYATEFSDSFKTAEMAAPHLLKMAVLMAASGVARAYWYAIQEERAFPNMGLFTQRQARKPGADAFEFVEKTLIPLGDPVRVETDGLSFVYRYGDKAVVLWGAPRAISVSGRVQAHDARGRPCALPTRLGDDPVILVGPAEVVLGEPDWLADSFYQFGQAPWSYFAEDKAGVKHPLDWVNWEWTSYIGDRRFRPMSFTPKAVAPKGDAARPVGAVLRYTFPEVRRIRASIEIHHGGRSGDGVDVTVRHGDRILDAFPLSAATRTLTFDVDGLAGDALELMIGPHATAGGDTVGYRMTILDPMRPPSLV